MRHQPCHPAVSVTERMDPEQTTMRRGGGKDRLSLASSRVNLFEPAKEPRHGSGADRHMLSHLYAVGSERPG